MDLLVLMQTLATESLHYAKGLAPRANMGNRVSGELLLFTVCRWRAFF